MRYSVLLGVAAAALAAAVNSAFAATVFQYGYGGTDTASVYNPANFSGLKAQVTFSIVGGNLVVDLDNEQVAPTIGGADLAGVFWNSSALAGHLVQVNIPLGSSVLPTGNDPGDAAFSKTADGPGSGQPYAITLSGLNMTYDSYIKIPGTTVGSSDGLDGVDGVLVGPNTTSFAPSGSGKAAIKHELVFTISGPLDDSFLRSISDVQFYYTTNSNPGSTVPLPAAVWGGMSMLGLLGVGSKLRKKLHR
jgi:hypothetical protein